MRLAFSGHVRRCCRCRFHAFSFAEVMVAIAMMGAAIVGVYGGIAQCFSMVQSARENLRATQILQDKTETIRLYTWEQLSNAIPATFTAKFYPAGSAGQQGLTYAGTLNIAAAPLSESYQPDMKLVTVTLNWRSANVNHQRQITTLISHYGLHNYINRE